MTDLNELFEQILHSERKFKARVDELKLGIMSPHSFNTLDIIGIQFPLQLQLRQSNVSHISKRSEKRFIQNKENWQ